MPWSSLSLSLSAPLTKWATSFPVFCLFVRVASHRVWFWRVKTDELHHRTLHKNLFPPSLSESTLSNGVPRGSLKEAVSLTLSFSLLDNSQRFDDSVSFVLTHSVWWNLKCFYFFFLIAFVRCVVVALFFFYFFFWESNGGKENLTVWENAREIDSWRCTTRTKKNNSHRVMCVLQQCYSWNGVMGNCCNNTGAHTHTHTHTWCRRNNRRASWQLTWRKTKFHTHTHTRRRRHFPYRTLKD